MTQLTTEQYWTVSSETGRFVGPFNQTDLNRLIAEGRLTTRSPVFKSVTRKWTEVGCVLAPPDLPPSSALPPVVGQPVTSGAANRMWHRSMPLGFVAAFASGSILTCFLTAWLASRHEQIGESILEERLNDQVALGGRSDLASDNMGVVPSQRSPIQSRFDKSPDQQPSPRIDLAGVDRTTGEEQSKRTARHSEAPSPDSKERLKPAPSRIVTQASSGHDQPAVRSDDRAGVFSEYRNWHDDTGRYSTTARLVDVQGSTVSLLKLDGTRIRVDRARLSDADSFFVEAVGRRGAPQDWNARMIEDGADPAEEHRATRLTAIATPRQQNAPRMQVGRTRTMNEVDRARFADYLDRRDERRVYATERLRQIHSMRGPHIYRTAIYAPVNPLGVSAIQAGWVYQPPIFRRYYRPYASVPSCRPRRLDSPQYYGGE